jgi:hypothetical protein
VAVRRELSRQPAAPPEIDSQFGLARDDQPLQLPLLANLTFGKDVISGAAPLQ